MNNKQKLDPDTFKELISITSERLKLPQPYVIEKDYYLTQAISLVTQIENEAFELVFQGGTCLAKAHRIIKRMSEDCDFRIRMKSSASLMSKETKRKTLRLFRREIVSTLHNNGFIISKF